MEHGDFSNVQGKKAPVIPHFYREAIEVPFKSQQAGRPIFEEREFVKVIVPGDRNAQPVYEVTEEHRARWADAYAAFARGEDAPVEGTPLKQWPPISKAVAAELAHFHILSVEQLAGVNDTLLQKLPMGMRELRRQAQTFLEVAAKGAAPIARLIAENEALKAGMTAKDEQLAALVARVETLEKAK